MRCPTLTFYWSHCLAAVCALLLTDTLHADTVTLPGDKKVETIDFERHIMGIFGKVGCNAGSCHGSFQGKGGFRLSLFGYDPQMDYLAVTRENGGRRVNPTDPDNSLLLLKATGAVEHGGLRRFGKDSWQYQLLRAWIVSGMKWTPGSGSVKSVRITPPEYAFKKVGEKGQLSVKATFANGGEEDITSLCDFRVNDDAVASVNNLGAIESRQAGDTPIIVSYRGHVVPVRVMVPLTLAKDFVYPQTPEVNYIDREVFAKLKRLNLAPSDLSGDLEFLRRITIDTIGTLPTPDEVRAFLADKDSKKREKKIDELLKHPMHAALWATKFCDITGNNTDALENPPALKAKRSQMWHEWFRKRLADNMPYDQIVHGVLCADSLEGRTPEEYIKSTSEIEGAAIKGAAVAYAERKTLDLFWRRQQAVPIDQWGEKTAVAFLGVRLECAQCHKHPFDRWTQTDYRAYANIFGPVSVGISPTAKKAFDAENAERTKNMQNRNQVSILREVFIARTSRGLLTHPETNAPLTPAALGGPQLKVEAGKDPREELFAWMKSKDNPFFARSFVNRVWGHYFGIGIVHPVDDFSLANPASNDKLLDALAKDFIESGFDIRKLERNILLSRTYQLTSTTNSTNKLDRNNFSRSYIRPLMAEVVVDVLNAAIGVSENFGNDAPAGSRVIEVGASRLQSQTLQYALNVFGRSPRTVACDCERSTEPTVAHKLYLMGDATLQAKFQAQKNRVRDLLTTKKEAEIIEELFLATLTRFPTPAETKTVTEYLAEKKDRAKAFHDILWALINTNEFIFNH